MKNTCSSLYTKEVMRHFKKPHNYGKIKDADGIGKVGNPTCGDVMWLYIKVKNDKIIQIKFETFGCVAAIATSSVITDLIKGKTIKEALKLEKDDIVKSLGGLPLIKYHCSILAVDALRSAIRDYKNKLTVKKKKVII
jgi:nitrogen fixation NifU-like protein